MSIERTRGTLLFGMRPGGAKGGGNSLPGAPILTDAIDGTPTADGAIAAGVTTDQGTGILYWAVVTDTGSCTTAQLKSGAGGNIVEGIAGSQVVGADGALTIVTITGLAASTTYQIKFLHTNGGSLDSAQASVDLTTAAP